MKTLLTLLAIIFFSGNILFGQITITFSSTNATCNGICNGTITPSVTGGSLPYTFNWSNTAITQNLTGLCAGTYFLTVTDAIGTPSQSSCTIIQPPTLFSSLLSSSNVTCFGGSNGSATVYATGGSPGYTYLWSNGHTSSTAIGLTAGTYSVTVRDINNCSSVTSVIISQPAVIALSNSTTPATCGLLNGTATVSVTSGGVAPWDFLWSNAASTMNTLSTTNSITGLNAAIYSVTVTDNNNCSSVNAITVTNIPNPISTFTQSPDQCLSGNSFNFTNTGSTGGGYTWNWTFAGGTPSTSTIANPIGITYNTPGSYTVTQTITGPGPCTSTTTSIVNIYSQPNANAGFDQTICATNQNVLLNGNISNGTTTGIWTTTGTGTFLPNNTTLNATYTLSAADIMSGTVDLTLTSTNNGNCNTVTDQMVITIMPAPTATFTAQSPICLGEPVMIVYTGLGGTIFNWNLNGATILAGSPGTGGPFTVTWNTANTYTVTLQVTDANGCSDTTDTVFVTVNDLPTATATITDATCLNNDGQISLTVSGGTPNYIYNWLPTGGVGTTATNLSAGTYFSVITDANGCSYSNSWVINQSSNPALITGSASYSGGNIGIGEAIAYLFKESSGTGSAQFDSLSSSFFTSTGFSFSNLYPGRYILEIVLNTPSNYPTLLNTYYNVSSI